MDARIDQLSNVPYTISFVIRKRLQVDNLNELPKEKRPSDELIWNSPVEELENWLDKMIQGKESGKAEFVFLESEIER